VNVQSGGQGRADGNSDVDLSKLDEDITLMPSDELVAVSILRQFGGRRTNSTKLFIRPKISNNKIAWTTESSTTDCFLATGSRSP